MLPDADRRRPACGRGRWSPSRVLAVFVAVNSLRIVEQASLLRVEWVKGAREPRPLFEKWNSFSRVTVSGDPTRPTPPQGWGLSATYPAGPRRPPALAPHRRRRRHRCSTGFDGRLEMVEHLKFDVTNAAHWLRRDARVLVVGTGGGRDVLSALAFGQREVVGVEINGDDPRRRQRALRGVHRPPRPGPARDVRQRRGAQLHRAPGPDASISCRSRSSTRGRPPGRARSCSASTRSTPPRRGASSSTVSRRAGCCRCPATTSIPAPDEMYRVTSLAVSALAQRGVTRPRDHLAIVRHATGADGQRAPLGVATLLVSPSPLSAADVDVLERAGASPAVRRRALARGTPPPRRSRRSPAARISPRSTRGSR